MPDEAPLILTLRFDAPGFERFDGMRKKHFPAARNFIPAHLTLFHHLPGDKLDTLKNELALEAGRHKPMACRVTGVRLLGEGVAYDIDCPQVERLRANLASRFFEDLVAQDRRRIKPHVTIQNKADPASARALHEELDDGFEPFSFTGTGLLLWHYRGGPWDLARAFPFGAQDRDAAESDS